MSVLEK